MAGVLSPFRGYVEIDGLRRRSSPEDELAIRRRTVYLPAHPWLPRHKTAREFLIAVGGLYDLEHERIVDHADRLLQLFELIEKGDAPIRSYSSGQKKKTALASALITEAPVMLLDEPFAGGLDPSGQLALKVVLGRLATRADVTVVMATPVPQLVEGLAHRIAVIKQGEIAAFDSIEGLRRLAGHDGPLDEVLQRLISPESARNIEHYFEGRE
jgi:ABC-type multidrug transport system ATPase subunit